MVNIVDISSTKITDNWDPPQLGEGGAGAVVRHMLGRVRVSIP